MAEYNPWVSRVEYDAVVRELKDIERVLREVEPASREVIPGTNLGDTLARKVVDYVSELQRVAHDDAVRAGEVINALKAKVEDWQKVATDRSVEIHRLMAINETLTRDHNALLIDGARWQTRAEKAEAELAQVKGAMAAQDEREKLAGEKCNILWQEHGCDWPDAVAERVIHLRSLLTDND